MIRIVKSRQLLLLIRPAKIQIYLYHCIRNHDFLNFSEKVKSSKMIKISITLFRQKFKFIYSRHAKNWFKSYVNLNFLTIL